MAIKKHRITPQDIEDVIACGYPLAQIARESGVDRVSLSKFRNHGQALKAADQAALIAWLQENDLWEDDGTATSAKPARATPAAAPAQATAAQVFPRPLVAVTIGDELDEDDAARLSVRADAVAGEIKRLAAGKLAYDDFIFQSTEPTEDSQAEHQKLITALAEFALLQFRLQGNDLAPPLPPELAEDGARLTTHAELLAREFPWPAGEPNPDPDADPSAESLAAGTEGKAQGRGQIPAKSASATVFG